MARRKKKRQDETLNQNAALVNEENINPEELLKDLVKSMDEVIEKEYGHLVQDDLTLLSFGIKPLDTLLGGGLLFGMPTMITGSGEIGKTTIAWQLIKRLQVEYPLSIAFYIDTEGAAKIENERLGIKSRPKLLNIDESKLIYKSICLTLEETFELIKKEIKKKVEIDKKIGKKIPFFIVWDSISDTPPGKVYEVDDPNKLVGLRARLIQFFLDQIKKDLRLSNTMLFMIDQVRSNIQDSMTLYRKTEKPSVGIFNDLRSATQSKAAEHKIRQWLFLSQGGKIFDLPDIDGWYITVYTEKCKLAPSKYALKCVFDKRYGIDKFWTEFEFLSNYTPTEELIIKKTSGSLQKEFIDSIPEFAIKQVGGGRLELSVYDSKEDKEYKYSKTFYKREAKKLYEEDEEFKFVFDKAVDIHVRDRIIKQFNPEIKEIVYQVQNIDIDKENEEDKEDNLDS